MIGLMVGLQFLSELALMNKILFLDWKGAFISMGPWKMILTALDDIIEQSCQKSWLDSQTRVSIERDYYFRTIGPENP